MAGYNYTTLLKKKTKHSEILLRYSSPVKTTFHNKPEIKTFSDRFITSRHTLKEISQDILQAEEKETQIENYKTQRNEGQQKG